MDMSLINNQWLKHKRINVIGLLVSGFGKGKRK